VTGTTRAPHGNPTGFPRLAFRDPEGSQLLLLPLRLLRQSLIDHLRDTVQSPYLLHPHNIAFTYSRFRFVSIRLYSSYNRSKVPFLYIFDSDKLLTEGFSTKTLSPVYLRSIVCYRKGSSF
jgi:hypothetical protein